MRRRLLSLLFIFLLSAAAMAQISVVPQSMPGIRVGGRSVSDYVASQKILLSNFCRLDYEGTRLQATGWNRFKSITSLRDNPEFERVVVVTRFDIELPEQISETVRVNYKAIGYYDFIEGYVVVSGNDRVIFRTQEQKDNLTVTEIAPAAPHVSPRAALEWMTMRMNDANTSELERAHLKYGIAELSKLVSQPKAAQ